jgi:hypothetical protein
MDGAEGRIRNSRRMAARGCEAVEAARESTLVHTVAITLVSTPARDDAPNGVSTIVLT